MPSWSQLRSSLFSHPKTSSAAVWATSTFLFLVPTCIELTPLGTNNRNAKGDRDDAKDAYDKTLNELNGIKEKIREARQRVIDLDCAMAGYQDFNQGITTFQKNIDASSAQPIDLLKSFWQLYF